MRITVDIINDKEVVQYLKKLNSFEAPEACRKAVRATARKAPPRFSKYTRERYTVKAARLKKDIGIKYIDRGFQALISTSYEPISMASFNVRKVSQGIRFNVYKGSPVNLRAGFMAKAPNHDTILPFARITNKPYPIRVIMGPSAAGIALGASKYGDTIMDKCTRELSGELSKEVKNAMAAMLRGFGRVTR